MKSSNPPSLELRRTNAKKIIFLAFLLSLLFHFGGLLYVTLQTNSEKTPLLANEQTQPDPQKQINKQQHNEWVEAKARAGNFGTPVFFQDEFESSSAEASADRPAAAEAIADKPTNTETPDDKPDITEEKEVIKDTSEDVLENKETVQEQPIPEEKNITAPQPASIVKEPTVKQPQRQTTSRATLPQKPSQAPKPLSAPKPPLTLAQLSQGFLNHVKHEGNHAVHMLGKKSGRPTDEQIKYERYLQKLSWCLQNSFNIHNDRFPMSANNDDSVQVLLALNKDGSLKQCNISKTSGNRDLDYFTLFIFKDASTSFPPVPEYLPHDPFAINYIIMVGASENGRLKLYRQ